MLKEASALAFSFVGSCNVLLAVATCRELPAVLAVATCRELPAELKRDVFFSGIRALKTHDLGIWTLFFLAFVLGN